MLTIVKISNESKKVVCVDIPLDANWNKVAFPFKTIGYHK